MNKRVIKILFALSTYIAYAQDEFSSKMESGFTALGAAQLLITNGPIGSSKFREAVNSNLDVSHGAFVEAQSLVQELFGQGGASSTEVQSLKNQVASLETDVTSLTNQLATRTSERDSAVGEKNSIQGQVSSLESQVTGLNSQITSLNTQLSNLQNSPAATELNALKTKLEELQYFTMDGGISYYSIFVNTISSSTVSQSALNNAANIRGMVVIGDVPSAMKSQYDMLSQKLEYLYWFGYTCSDYSWIRSIAYNQRLKSIHIQFYNEHPAALWDGLSVRYLAGFHANTVSNSYAPGTLKVMLGFDSNNTMKNNPDLPYFPLVPTS
ncbi:MAG: hypothetical protein LBJ89_00300 [Holosporales bacterium]|jgi:chaperonin cofactor prefoldin|nr:hypothetical protein [Holosporales bacterium]